MRNTDLKIYPNPTTKYINIKGIEEITATFKIQDSLGKTVLEKENSLTKVDISGFKSGVYVISIFKGREFIDRLRIIKK